MFYAVSSEQQEQFVEAYVRTAAWAAGVGGPDDLNEWGHQALRVEAQTATDTDQHLVRLIQCANMRDAQYTWEQAGHDFYLTRERHGTGFWDRDLGLVGEALTQVAHAWGESDVHLDFSQ